MGAGVCMAVGPKVTKFQVGDHVGVGCMVDACLECKQCKQGNENMCKKGMVQTYGDKDKFGRAAVWPNEQGKGYTFGGYSSKMVVHEHFGIQIPKNYPLEAAGPVLCSGITMYEPLKTHGCKKGTRVGVIGLGGLGIMGIKIAKEMGAVVTAISRSEAKKDLAMKCGADNFIATSNAEAVADATGSLDLILDTFLLTMILCPTCHFWMRMGSMCCLGLRRHGLLRPSQTKCSTVWWYLL